MKTLLVFTSVVLVVLVVLKAIKAMPPASPKRRPTRKGEEPESVNVARFQEYADLYEKRYLAYLISAIAEKAGADMATIDRLRDRYGKEVLAPPYEAQGWLYAKGISLSDILHMQAEWIRRNGGNPEARPAAREVERIIKSRNIEKAKKVWEQNHA